MSTNYSFQLQELSKNIYDNRHSLSCHESVCSLECVYRTVANRSYYAAYSHAKIWAEDQLDFDEDIYFKKYRNEINNRIGRHQTLFTFILRKAKEESHRILAHRLGNIKSLRTKADYGLEDKVTKKEAKDSLMVASSVINYLN